MKSRAECLLFASKPTKSGEGATHVLVERFTGRQYVVCCSRVPMLLNGGSEDFEPRLYDFDNLKKSDGFMYFADSVTLVGATKGGDK